MNKRISSLFGIAFFCLCGSVGVANATTTSDSITIDDFVLTFSGNVQYVTAWNGEPIITNFNGETLQSISGADGYDINPVGDYQSLSSDNANGELNSNYIFPYEEETEDLSSFAMGDSLVLCTHMSDPSGRQLLQTTAVVTTQKDAVEGQFRPGYVGGTIATNYTPDDVDWDYIASVRQTYLADDMCNARPSASKYNIYRLPLELSPERINENVRSVDSGYSSYGAYLYRYDMHNRIWYGTLYDNDTANDNLLSFVQYGLDLYNCLNENGYIHRSDGGHYPAYKMYVFMAAELLNDETMLKFTQWSADKDDSELFQSDKQMFYVAQEHVDMTASSSWNPASGYPSEAYTTDMIGTPEWGVAYPEDKTSINAALGAKYRAITKEVYVRSAALVAHYGDKYIKDWGRQVYWEYVARIASLTDYWTDDYAYILLEKDYDQIINGDSESSSITVNLPSPSGYDGKINLRLNTADGTITKTLYDAGSVVSLDLDSDDITAQVRIAAYIDGDCTRYGPPVTIDSLDVGEISPELNDSVVDDL